MDSPPLKNDTDFIYFDSLESLLGWDLEKSTRADHIVHGLENFTWKIDSPRTLLCHDHRGGYLEYEGLKGSHLPLLESPPAADQPLAADLTGQLAIGQPQHTIPFYSFFHWWYIDIFVYFSHHFVTVPPIGWTNQAHKHGVLVLGTFITEADEICGQIFSDPRIVEQIISKMVGLCKNCHFDGWLINIENKIDRQHLDVLEYFLKNLRYHLKSEVHKDTKVIWYDSVTADGELKWQNTLNEDNRRWFDWVDGFYTNYSWEEKHINRCVDTLSTHYYRKRSSFDVYIGIDVFGRGCLGGGGWACALPMEIARRYNLSVAIFAPGWICENFPQQGQTCLFQNSFRFWDSLKAFLFPHPVTAQTICTNFSIGFDSNDNVVNVIDGKQLTRRHFCLQNGGLQPFYLGSAALRKDMEAGLIVDGGGVHPLFHCDIPVGGKGFLIRYKSFPKVGAVVVTIHEGERRFNDHHFHSSSDNDNDAFGNVLDNFCPGSRIVKISLWNKPGVVARLLSLEMRLVKRIKN